MRRLVVFTARLGDTDELRPPAVVDPTARYLCFSDTPCAVPPYEWIRVPPAADARLASRQIKILADHPILKAADATLWHDASYQLLRGPQWVLHRLSISDLIGIQHPKGRCIEEEAEVIARYGYLSLEAAQAHVARYRAAGFLGVYITSGGLLGRRVSSQMTAFNRLWWQEVQRWGGRDQASLDYAAWAVGIRISYLKGTVRDNLYAAWREQPEQEPAEEAVC